MFSRRIKFTLWTKGFAALTVFPRPNRRNLLQLHDPTKIRNIALVAHIDSGKTTLTESILLQSQYLSSPGSVDTGSTTTDFLPAERARGITIQSASIPVKWQDWTFNLIDTPGHADFGMEVESASRVIDGAVVLIDSVEGVEAQTRGVWRQLERYNVPTRLIFMNKMDRPGASFRAATQSLLNHRLHPQPMALTLPIASFDPQDYVHGEPGIQGLVDLVKWQVWKWDAEGQSTCLPLPSNPAEIASCGIFPETHPIIPHLVPARTSLLENLAMFSEDLMERLINPGPNDPLYIQTPQLIEHLRQATLGRTYFRLANPLDFAETKPESDDPVRALAWKVGWDKKKGWMTFVRVYSGTLKRQSSIFNTNRNTNERVSKLLLLYASQVQEVDELPVGSVGVILGLRFTRTGDTLVSSKAPASSKSAMRDIIPPPAVVSAAVIPQSHSDLQPVQDALESLSRTDPSVRVDAQEGQILVHGLGSLHLEILEGRLRDEWEARFEFGKRRVSYRESLGSGPISRDTGAVELAGALIPMSLQIRALRDDEEGNPLWDGNIVLDDEGRPMQTPASQSSTRLAFISAGIAGALSNSPNSSLPDFLILCHSVRLVWVQSWNLLSPSVLQASEESLGKKKEVEGFPEDAIYMPPAWLSPAAIGSTSSYSFRSKRAVRAVAPLSQMLDYSNRLRALSGGHGQFEMANVGFRHILREIGRA
ncbi:P-loop containing nucleoside triphosphate hydrolase protein [Mycena floridula]|nr:P-loop containing nucleoside triphosphate hydrolase protein [Mycena floridula]